jgi:hypothetical protein
MSLENPAPAPVLGNIPLLHLAGEAAERYLAHLVGLIDTARLNKFFPNPMQLMSLYDHMRPSRNYGLSDAVDVMKNCGLPGERDVLRVVTDGQLSSKVLADDPRETLLAQYEQSHSAAARRRLDRWDYHQSLSVSPPPSAVDLRLALMRVDTDTRTAHFTVTFDRFDMAEGVFARYTIILAQQASRWKKQQVELIGDDLEYTSNFSNVIARFTSHEAEFAYLLLSDLPNVVVEEVVRCRVGPFYFAGMDLSPDFVPLFERIPDAYLLHLPMERVGRSVQQEGCGDPLAVLYRDFLAGEAREVVVARSRKLGYRVWKERKFATTTTLEADLKKLLAARGKPCVIRSMPPIPPAATDEQQKESA